jgi:predicted aldo/keto reductase-like oxidoreductase
MLHLQTEDPAESERWKSMKYRLFGESGLRVSEMSLGAMTFGEDWGWGAPKDEARKIYDAYRSAGGNFIDTANVYTNGPSEKLVGEFMQDHRQEIVWPPSTATPSRETTPMPPAIIARAWCNPWRALCGG